MEEKLLEILKLTDLLNEKQNKVYAKIQYTADDRKNFEIYIISKQNYSFMQQLKVELCNETIISLDDIIELLKRYLGGASDE